MIPDQPLDINLPATDKWTLNDLELFERGGFTVKGFKAFMGRYSNWTADEVGLMEVGEMQEVFERIADGIQEHAVPKANGASSAPGQLANKPRRRAGPRA
jgi:hypothetical protein